MMDTPIARSARRLRILVLAGIALLIGVYLLAQLGPQLGPIRVQTHADSKSWAGQVAAGVSVALYVLALARLARMLSAIADGPMFDPRVTRAFRGFAFWLFLATLVDVLGALALEIANQLSAAGGRVELAFELRDLLLLAGALFLFLLARMLEQARVIEAKLQEIV